MTRRDFLSFLRSAPVAIPVIAAEAIAAEPTFAEYKRYGDREVFYVHGIAPEALIKQMLTEIRSAQRRGVIAV